MRKVTAIEEVVLERENQDIKWGAQNHFPLGWLAILMEEVGETSKEACEGNMVNYRKEMIQVAAVAVAAIESIDRNLLRDLKNLPFGEYVKPL